MLRLDVTKTWGNRTLAVNSSGWKKLRKKILERDNHQCRFCRIRLSKYLVCDHIDGNASNNDPNNLGINCPGCDKIRHCGLSGLYQHTQLWLSQMPQSEIVQKTHQYVLERHRVPEPREIDPLASPTDIDMARFANILIGCDHFADIVRNAFKGFFTSKTKFKYLDNLLSET